MPSGNRAQTGETASAAHSTFNESAIARAPTLHFDDGVVTRHAAGQPLTADVLHVNPLATAALQPNAFAIASADDSAYGTAQARRTMTGQNDDWDAALAPTFDAVYAFPLDVGSKDAALVVPLTAGETYTVVVRGADGGVGEALVELYEVP